MIRHTNSIFISLFIHFTLFVTIFYGITHVVKPVVQEEKVCIKLCSLQQTKQEEQPNEVLSQEPPTQEKTQPIEEIKKEIPKIQPAPKKVEPKKIEPKKIVAEKKEEPKETVEQKELSATLDTAMPDKAINQPLHVEANTQKIAQNEAPSQKIKEEDAYLQEHIALIKKLLEENLYYPRSARQRGIMGDVLVKFELSPDATITYIKVLNSPSEVLSRGAVQTIENVSTKFPKPKKVLTLEVPISYKLSDEKE